MASTTRQVGKRVTAADVARSLGLSRATVGFVLNDTPGQTIPPATRERVLTEAARLGYRPHSAARALASGRSPAAEREVLDPRDADEERVLLGLRTVEGVPLSLLQRQGLSADEGKLGDLLADGFDQATVCLNDAIGGVDEFMQHLGGRLGRLHFAKTGEVADIGEHDRHFSTLGYHRCAGILP